jgi:hypothetical protein
MRASPAGDDHGGPLSIDPVSIRIEQFSLRKWEGIQILNKFSKRMDSHLSIGSISDSVDSLDFPPSSSLNMLQESWKSNLAFSCNNVIDPWVPQDPFGIATDMGASHHDNFLRVPFLNELCDLKGLSMIGSERGGDSKDIRSGLLNFLPDLIPPHPEMIKTRIKLERTSIIERVEILKIRNLAGDRARFFLLGLAIENLDIVPVDPQRSRKIGQADRLGPNGSPVEILNRRLNEKDFHKVTVKV